MELVRFPSQKLAFTQSFTGFVLILVVSGHESHQTHIQEHKASEKEENVSLEQKLRQELNLVLLLNGPNWDKLNMMIGLLK